MECFFSQKNFDCKCVSYRIAFTYHFEKIKLEEEEELQLNGEEKAGRCSHHHKRRVA